MALPSPAPHTVIVLLDRSHSTANGDPPGLRMQARPGLGPGATEAVAAE
jgi:hypothetical protein